MRCSSFSHLVAAAGVGEEEEDALPRVLLANRHLLRASVYSWLIDSGLVGSTDLGGVPREQNMLKGHLPRVIYHQVLGCRVLGSGCRRGGRGRASASPSSHSASASCERLFRVIDSGLVGLVRSHVERRCSVLGPTQSRISPSIL